MSLTDIMSTIPIPLGLAGAWDEPGLIRGLDRRGFTPTKCGSELIANSWDAGSKKVIFKIVENAHHRKVKQIDIGKGMTTSDLQNMFSIHRSNNQDKQSMGVSGLGGKEANYILSKQKNTPSTVYIYTKSINGPFIKVIVPWKKIFDELRYVNQVEYYPMTNLEIDDFINDRSSEFMEDEYYVTGTTIEWNYSDEFLSLLESQFDNDLRKTHIGFKDRWDVIFGLTGMKIIFDKGDGTASKELELYNYFNGDDIDYYTGKKVETIEHYQDINKNDHYIWKNGNGQSFEFSRNGRGISKTLQPCNITMWSLIGEYFVYMGLRKNKTLFDEQNPRMPNSAEMFLCDYDSRFFNIDGQRDFIRNELAKIGTIRNEQFITNFQLDGVNSASSRANWQSMLKIFHIRAEIRYSTLSSQDSPMDIAMGIQENKNQHQDSFPVPFVRMVTYFKDEFCKTIMKHFEDICQCCRNKNTRKVPLQLQIEEGEEEESSVCSSSLYSSSNISTLSETESVYIESCNNMEQPFPNIGEVEEVEQVEEVEINVSQPLKQNLENNRELLMNIFVTLLEQENDQFINEILDFIKSKQNP
jgi:hypothetical protein